jgi:type I restriction enzyme S subunit
VSYPAINASDLVDIGIPIPPIEVQRCIAGFLDKKVAQIDGLIEKLGGHASGQVQKSLSGLLFEYRSALITSAITGQLPELNG